MAIDSKNLLVWVKAMSRGQDLPLDASEIWESKEAAETYARGLLDKSTVAYAGQQITVVTDDDISSYIIAQDGSLKKLATFTQDESGKLTLTDTNGNTVLEINPDGEGSINIYSLTINGQPLEDFIKEVAPEPEVITDAEIIALVNEVFPEEV